MFIEKVISSRILKLIADNDLIDKLHIGVVTDRKLCYVFIMILVLWLERATGHSWFN